MRNRKQSIFAEAGLTVRAKPTIAAYLRVARDRALEVVERTKRDWSAAKQEGAAQHILDGLANQALYWQSGADFAAYHYDLLTRGKRHHGNQDSNRRP